MRLLHLFLQPQNAENCRTKMQVVAAYFPECCSRSTDCAALPRHIKTLSEMVSCEGVPAHDSAPLPVLLSSASHNQPPDTTIIFVIVYCTRSDEDVKREYFMPLRSRGFRALPSAVFSVFPCCAIEPRFPAPPYIYTAASGLPAEVPALRGLLQHGQLTDGRRTSRGKSVIPGSKKAPVHSEKNGLALLWKEQLLRQLSGCELHWSMGRLFYHKYGCPGSAGR